MDDKNESKRKECLLTVLALVESISGGEFSSQDPFEFWEDLTPDKTEGSELCEAQQKL